MTFIVFLVLNMDFAGPGFTYVLLLIPALFAAAVTGQGIYKISKKEEGGSYILGFGIVFFILIAGAFFLFIK